MPINLGRLSKFFKVQGPDDLAVIIGTDDQAIPDPKQTTEKAERKHSVGVSIFGELDDGRDRKAGYKDYRIIDANIPEFSRALTVIATVATAGDREIAEGFRIEYSTKLGKQDQAIIEDLINKRLALKEQIYGIVRSANKFGDVFKELIVDKKGLIWKLKNLEPELTDRVHDEFDRHLGFKFAGYEKEEQALDWWQVIHLRHDKEDGENYGRSLFAGGGRELASRITALRDGLTYETLNHATARNAIILARPARWSQEQVDAWLDDIQDRVSREHVVDSSGKLTRRAITLLNGQDVILDYPIDIEGKGVAPMVQPLKNAPIVDARNIAEHFQDILFVVTGVPKAFMGIERHREGLGSNRLDKQDKQFTRQVFRDQLDAGWFVEEIIRRQFILLRRPLPEEAFKISFPSLRHEDKKLKAEIFKLRYETSTIARSLGLNMEYIWNEIIFDGDEAQAAEAADKYGVSFEEPEPDPDPEPEPGSDPGDKNNGKNPRAKPPADDDDKDDKEEKLQKILNTASEIKKLLDTESGPTISNRAVTEADFLAK